MPQRILGFVLTVVMFSVVLSMHSAGVAYALQTTPPPYAHAWYVTDPSPTTMYNLGWSDGSFDTSSCTNAMVMLDFGQPDLGSGSGYGGYGTYDFASGQPYISDATIVAAAENYASGWYHSSSTCPKLKLVVGTNNYHQCLSGGSCSPNTAGYYWGSVVNDVQNYLSSNRYSSQVTAFGGSEMEQPGAGRTGTAQPLPGSSSMGLTGTTPPVAYSWTTARPGCP